MSPGHCSYRNRFASDSSFVPMVFKTDTFLERGRVAAPGVEQSPQQVSVLPTLSWG